MLLRSVSIAVSIILDRTLFPLTFIELTTSLEKLGFEINTELPFPRPVGRFVGSGQIARKGNISIGVDGGANSIMMIGISLETVLEEFDSFMKTLQADYSVDLDEFANYYQFASRYKYRTEKNPYAIISDSCTYPKLDELAKIIEIPIKNYAIRVGSADTVPYERNWFGMDFAADMLRNDCYVIDVLYRNENRESYRTFISHIEESIMKSIELLEG